jgi:hypothetical protein
MNHGWRKITALGFFGPGHRGFGGAVRDQIDTRRGDLNRIILNGVAEFVPRSARVGRSLRGALFSMGARKKLSQSIGPSAQ